MNYRVLMGLGILCCSADWALGQSSTNMKNGTLTFKLSETSKPCSDAANLPELSTLAPNIIHYVTWTSSKEYTERWLVQGKNASEPGSKRIYGSSQIRVVAIHDKVSRSTEFTYKVDVKKKSPSWLQNLISLAGVKTFEKEQLVCKVGYLDLNDVPVPSDITVSGAKVTDSSRASEQGASTVADTGFTETFDNEGKYWADFSFGLPILNKKVTDFEVSNGILQRKDGSRAAAHGFVNLFLIGGPRDTKKRGFHPPHLMIGVPLNGKALDNPVAAMGFTIAQAGIQFDIYAGCSFNRTEVSRVGLPGTDPRWVRKLTVGLNIPVGQFLSTYLKKK
jgi:hypothetical protein